MGILKWKREFEDIKRLEQIISVLAKEGYHLIIRKIKPLHFFKLDKDGLSEDKIKEPERVRKLLEKLGPTFVKLGQLLSLRPDLIPQEYVEEFKKLQDDVKPFSFEQAKNIIEKELGDPKDLFKSIEKKPLSAASVSQVHKAILKNGKNVVIKVQRPGIKKIMKSDIDLMFYFANILDKHDEFKNLNLIRIVEEFRDYTERELDFRFELRNIKKFHEYFKTWKKIKIPEPYTDYSTNRVLVMEYISGTKLTEKSKLKKKHSLKKIADLGFKAVMYQIFDLGIFHGDPHPANLIYTKSGKLAFIDFGIVGFVSPDIQNNVLKMVVALINRDVKRGVKYFTKMSKITEESDVDSFKEEAEKLVGDWYGTTFKEMRFTTLIYRIIRSANNYNIQVPTDVVLIAKSLLTIEGTGIQYDPNFDLVKKTKPILNKILLKKFSPKNMAETVKKDLLDWGDYLYSLPEKTEKIIDMVEKGEVKVKLQDKEVLDIERSIEKSSSKRSLAMLVGFIFLSSAILAQLDKELKVFGYDFYILGFILAIILSLILMVIFLKK